MRSGVTWTLRYAPRAVRALQRLDPQVRRRIRAAIERIAKDPSRGKPLQFNLRGLRSVRTGDYRIIYQAREKILEILVVGIGHRRDVFERARRF